MQARENTRGDRLWREFSREMYPFPSGYRFQTGGIMANLRNSTTIDKVGILSLFSESQALSYSASSNS